MAKKKSTTTSKVSLTVRGRAESILQAGELNLEVKGKVTPRKILEEIARVHPEIKSGLMRADGTPRLSTKILIDGGPPFDLDETIPVKAKTSVVMVDQPACDG